MSPSRGLLAAVALACLLTPAPAADPPARTDPAGQGRFTLPTDPKTGRKLAALRDYVASEDWPTVARVAQDLLDSPTDVFVPMPVKQPDGKEVDTHVGIRVATNRVLAGLPRDALDAYNRMHQPTAKASLEKAIKDDDKYKLADVARRYLWTDAGAEAAERLANRLLDDKEFPAAAQAYERLLERISVDKLEPLTLYKAARAFARGDGKEDRANREKVWKQLRTKAPKGLRIDGRDRGLKELEDELDKSAKEPLPLSRLEDWPTFGGSPSRDAQAAGGPPFLMPRWVYSLFASDTSSEQVKKWVLTGPNSVNNRLERKGEAVIPAFVPITWTVIDTQTGGDRTLILYRDYEGIAVVNLKTGKRLWIARSPWSLEGMLKPGRGQAGGSLAAWVQQFTDTLGRPEVLIENAAVGTISHDGRRVYYIDDLHVPPAPDPKDDNPGKLRINDDVKPAVGANKLTAAEIATGRLLWDLGGVKIGDGDGLKYDFTDSYFLGAPLCLDGKLYFLNEKQGEVRLVCLDTAKVPKNPTAKTKDDAIAWVLPLGKAKEKILDDYGRRINGAHVAYGGGALVCPTNCGVLVGVDALTHTVLWAHRYGDEAGKAPAASWKASVPVVQGGKVVFALPDGHDLRCLDLRDGRLLWSEKRRDDDVYLGGVVAGRVLVVGKREVRALSLDDGKEAWRLATGMPSGRGAASDNVYYLPLRDTADKQGPEVVGIDVAKGRAISHARVSLGSRRGNTHVCGNIVFSGDTMVSQSATELAAYPILSAKLALLDELLKQHPKDPRGLFERAELRHAQGSLAGAVEDYRAALANDPPPDLRARARAGLLDAMTDLLRQDFGAGEKYLKEWEALLRDSPDDVKRRATVLAAKGRGYESQGKALDALDAYLSLAALKGAALLPAADDPSLTTSPAAWARGRIAAMHAAANEAARARLDDEITRRGAAVRKGKDDDALRGFVAVFSPTFAAGREAQRELAERLMEGDRAAQLDAEALLLRLAEQAEDPTHRARAVEALARLMTRRGLLEDALHYYQRLAREFPTAIIRDGKKGADYLEDLSSDKRFQPYLEEKDQRPTAAPRWRAALTRTEKTDKAPALPELQMSFAPRGEMLPSLRRLRVTLNQGGNRFKFTDRLTGKERTATPAGANLVPLPLVANTDPPSPYEYYGYHAAGHVLVVNRGPWLMAYDALGNRILWESSLVRPAPGRAPEYRIDPEDGSLYEVVAEKTTRRVAQLGPVAGGVVVLLTPDGLTAIDVLTGAPAWHRADVPAASAVFGDDQRLYVVERGADGKATRTRAFGTRDGAAVEAADFRAAYDNRVRIAGGELVVADRTEKELVLWLYDVAAGKDVWSQKYPAGTVVMRSHDPDLAGVISPDGRLSVMSLSRRRVVLGSIVDVEDTKRLKQAHLLADEASIYVAFDTKSRGGEDMPAGSNLQPGAGIRAIPVNGEVYAFDRRAGKIRWHNTVQHQLLVLDQFAEMPVLLFTSRYSPGGPPKWRGGTDLWVDINIEAYVKTNGKMFYCLPSVGQAPLEGRYNGLVRSINYDPGAGKIELVADTYKLTITREK